MKKTNLLILAASLLGLAACGGNNTSTSNTSEEPTSQTTPTTDDTSTDEETSTSEEVADWDETSKAKFEEYFSGYAIPYAPMGEITYQPTGDATTGEDFYLDLYGTKNANLLVFKANAIALGYSVTEYEATEEDPAYVEAFYDFDGSDYSYSLSVTYSANDVDGSGSYMSIYKPGNKGNNSYDDVDAVKEAVHTACSLPDDGTWIDLNRNAENPWYQIDVDTEYESTDDAMKQCSEKYFGLVKDGVIAAQVSEEVTSGIDGYEFAFTVTTDKGDVAIYSVVISGDTEADICQIEFQVQYTFD